MKKIYLILAMIIGIFISLFFVLPAITFDYQFHKKVTNHLKKRDGDQVYLQELVDIEWDSVLIVNASDVSMRNAHFFIKHDIDWYDIMQGSPYKVYLFFMQSDGKIIRRIINMKDRWEKEVRFVFLTCDKPGWLDRNETQLRVDKDQDLILVEILNCKTT